MDSLDAFSGSYNERLLENARKKRVPISGTFELLPNCNMRCRMCYIQHTPRADELLPVEFWIDAFEQAIVEGLLLPLITGGEPFLYPQFDRLFERISKMPLYTCINTNATLLDRERVKWLAINPPKRLNISLYGASDETYSKLCNNPNGFSQVMNALDLLQEYGIPYQIHSVVVPENVDDYQGIIDICNKRRVKLGMANYMLPPYRKDGCGVIENARFSPKQMAQQSLVYLRDHFKNRDKDYLIHLSKHCAAIEIPQIYSLYGKDGVVCRGGICTFWLDWRGNLTGCGMHNQGAVSLHTNSFKDAWQQVVDYTEKIHISQKCKECKYRCICQNCPAAGFCETGRMDGTPEYLCEFCKEYAELLKEERRRVIERM